MELVSLATQVDCEPGSVFHLFSSGNPDFIIYMDELRVDEFGMNFQLQCSKHLRYECHIQYVSTFYAKLV